MKILLNILFLCGVATFCVFLAEFGVRVFLPVYDPSGMVEFKYSSEDRARLGPKNTTVRQWKNTGDYDVRLSFNKYGLRDDKDLKESNKEDLWVIGDSMSLGWGVEQEERYSDLVAARTGKRVFNVAIPGGLTGYEELLHYVIAQGAQVKNVILGFVMENDLVDLDTIVEDQLGQPGLVPSWKIISLISNSGSPPDRPSTLP